MSNAAVVSKEIPPDLTESSASELSISSAAPSDGGLRMKNSRNEINKASAGREPASFSVLGIYKRLDVTEEEEESRERQYVCARRRMRTRPFDPDTKDKTRREDTKDARCEEETNDENGESEGEDQEVDDARKGGSSESDWESAMFVPGKGLVGSEFWHEYDEEAKTIREDRAVLFQSEENYKTLLSHEKFSACFEGIDYLETPTFGEQIIVNGTDTSELAIGDVFEIEGKHSPLVVEITAPRKPCAYMNLKNGTRSGKRGIMHYTHHSHRAGWFARVLVAGELLEGMKFVRTSHPNPKWTLDYIYVALYGEGTKKEQHKNAASWNRSREELAELIALPQLGEYEWKVEGRLMLLKLDGIDWETVRYDRIDPQYKVVPNHYFMQFSFLARIYEMFIEAIRYFFISVLKQ